MSVYPRPFCVDQGSAMRCKGGVPLRDRALWSRPGGDDGRLSDTKAGRRFRSLDFSSHGSNSSAGQGRFGAPTIRHFVRSKLEFLWFLVSGCLFSMFSASFYRNGSFCPLFSGSYQLREFGKSGIFFGQTVMSSWGELRRENQWHIYFLNACVLAARLTILQAEDRIRPTR